ncbi:pyridoxal phosphate-dependent aminotransferase [Nitrospirales bacterium NOB]|nr:putative N-succinyldiaminopimelate aminotransferase DapC [Nitrospirota bacterium]MCE7963808.1 pyridoxal phosphate-dependent aminotransferase [Nitrospira sp. NTP2]MDL1888634.1 pyridoxal phosphate-dependent aminotransferase [Nitrospirales bacterium NOB]MEB2337540.1 pyridoxal phosphate-dependent aminotransferase [Nitrospirales bacterium]
MRTGNQRMEQMAQSEIRAMTQACARVNGINMAQGVCDTGVPSPVAQAAQRAIDLGVNIYTRYDGLPELRQAIAKKLASYNQLTVDPEQEVTVSAGATGSFHCACLALLSPGDEVIVFEPYYAYHISALVAVEAVPRVVRMHPPDWSVSRDELQQAITGRTKAIILNSPGNPSGKVFTREELEWVAALARRHDLFVFTDEIYEYFLFDARRHISIATLPDMAEQTITIGGYSKTFSITGWRIGYSAAHAKWAQLIGAMNDLLYVCAPAPLQYGVARGIEELPTSFYLELAREYQQKRDRFCGALAKAGLTPSVPEGAYYVLADISRLPGSTGKERAMYLLEQTGVAGVPGEAFFSSSDGHRFMRFCFAKTDGDLAEACERLTRLAL